jgi:pimeloyl-ACP methyl ester carboxylesterase
VATRGQSTAPARAPARAPQPLRNRKRVAYLAVIILVVSLGGFGLREAADAHLRAMSVLTRLSNPGAQGFPARFAGNPFTEQEGIAQTAHGPLKFRLYMPLSQNHSGGIVLLHGIHRAGIEEPRLINFARTMAGAGIEVMTPELQDLADYQVTPRTVDVIGDAAAFLSGKMDLPKVGVVGLSFAGGLALLAANKPEYVEKIGFVVAVGAHDDMNRVARFFAANLVERPDGSAVAFQAHEYGVLVLAYSHIEDFFSPQEAPVAREALRQWLWERAPDAIKTAQGLSPAGRDEFDRILHHRDLLQPELFQEIERHSAEMQAVSPHSQIGGLRVPVYLLHGAGDSVIPASETLWLAKDVPPDELKSVLISPAMNMIHVDGQHPAAISEKWALVDFMAQVLSAADGLGQRRTSIPAKT